LGLEVIQDPLISVIIPTYNRARELTVTINTVLAQTYRQFEIIVVDDGSTDPTADVIQALIKQSDGARQTPIRYFYQTNKGASIARNKGIAEATGNWIAFLDSDDVWLAEKLMWQVRAIKRFENSCGACFTNAQLVDRAGLDTTAFAHASKHYEDMIGIVVDPAPSLAKAFGCIWVQTLLARSDLVQKIGGFDPDLQFGEDYDFMFRLSLETAYCYVNQPLAVIERTNSHIDPTMAPREWDKVEFRLRMQQHMHEKWLNLKSEYSESVHRTIIFKLMGTHSGWANWYLENKQFDNARRAVSEAMKYHITPKLAFKWLLTWIAPRVARRLIPKTATML
jgi:glycosyltransferase involved in cell wall biosynthesis